MVKSNYLSNSAKLLICVCVVLLATNALLVIGSLTDNLRITDLGTTLSKYALYIVLVVGLIAFNGEGVCYKRLRNRKKKKVTDSFKWYIFICFIMNYIKGGFEAFAMSLEGNQRTVACLIMSLVSTIVTYGCLLWVASLWYIIRDKANKKLFIFEVVAFAFGLISNAYKFLNYAVAKYEINIFGNGITEVFSDNSTLRILFIVQLIFEIVMLVRVIAAYDALTIQEQEEEKKNNREAVVARNIYKEEGFGIDTLEDDFLLAETTEE